MHYREAGRAFADAMPIVLLHQNPSSSWEYEPLMRYLGQGRRVIALDTPGYGMSDLPDRPLSMAEYAQAFWEGLDHLEVRGPVQAYGFHTGALLAIELALARPERVDRIAVTGIPMYPADKRGELLAKAEATPPPTEDGREILEMLSRLWAVVVQQRDQRVPLDRAVRAFADKSSALETLHWAYHGVWSYDYSRLPQLSCAALLLQPDETLRDASLDAAKLIPDCTVVMMDDLQRDIFELAPERLANELRNFLG